MFLYMNCKIESVTSVKFGASAGASNATELSASGGLRPLTPTGALPPEPQLGAPPLAPYVGSRSRALYDRGSSLPAGLALHKMVIVIIMWLVLRWTLLFLRACSMHACRFCARW